MRTGETCSSKTLVENSTRLVHEIADMLGIAAEISPSDFHAERLRRLSNGFRSLDGPLTKIAGHLDLIESGKIAVVITAGETEGISG